MNDYGTASQLIVNTYRQYGRCALSCECGAMSRAIDADAIGNDASIREVVELIDHARYAHRVPRAVIVTVQYVALEAEAQDDAFGGYGQGFTTACILAAIGHAPDNCECSESYRQRGEHTPGCPADTGERV